MKFLIFLTIISVSFAINLDLSYEGNFISPPTVEVDPKIWVNPDTKWYFVYSSKYNQIRELMAVTSKKAEEITEKELESSCIYLLFGPKIRIGVNEHLVTLDTNTTQDPAKYDWKFNTENPVFGKSYLVLTNHKTYYLSINRWDFQNLGWVVLSTEKYMENSILEEVSEKVKSLGFDLDKTVKLDPKSCGEI